MDLACQRTRHGRLAFFHWGIAALLLAASTPVRAADVRVPATQPISPVEAARLQRGLQVRKVLLDAMEQSYANGGIWPERLPASPAGGLALVYERPGKVPDARFPEEFAQATVVVHEPLETRPGGVWVGCADGHLEFARSAEALAGCQNQSQVIQAAIDAFGDPVDPIQRRSMVGKRSPSTAPAADEKPPGMAPRGGLAVRVVDPDGHPVAGARLGRFGDFGDIYPPEKRVTFSGDKTIATDENGAATIPAAYYPDLSGSAVAADLRVPLYVLHEQRGLIAMPEVRASEFDGGSAVREIRLRRACKVSGEVTCTGLRELGRGQPWTSVIAYRPGEQRLRAVGCESYRPQFELLLPPGDYCLRFFGGDTDETRRYIRIEPDRGELHLEVDVAPTATVGLLGHPAPEFRQIAGWKNGHPVTLADLRGKFVLLDFWGYWCGPCIGAMPDLMKLHDEFRGRGLVIVAVHDDSVGSIEEMDRKLAPAREKFWGGRDLPFLVALDGGGETRIRYSALTARGVTTAAYGIQNFPTGLLIGPDGTVLREFNVRRPEARAELDQLLPKETPGK